MFFYRATKLFSGRCHDRSASDCGHFVYSESISLGKTAKESLSISFYFRQKRDKHLNISIVCLVTLSCPRKSVTLHGIATYLLYCRGYFNDLAIWVLHRSKSGQSERQVGSFLRRYVFGEFDKLPRLTWRLGVFHIHTLFLVATAGLSASFTPLLLSYA